MDVLKIDQVSKHFGKLHVLKDINLTIQAAEIVTLVGPNGSGKTTLMKAISNLMTVDSGTILINGMSAKDQREDYVKQLSCLIEAPAFYDMLTGYQNLKLIGQLNRASNQEIDEVLSFINIGPAIHRKVKGYSLGMKQRLALGMAVIQNPSLIILDEPTNGLDLTGVMEFRKMIRRLVAEKKVSLLISTHIVSDIESLSDRLVFLKEGKLYELDNMDVNLNLRHAILSFGEKIPDLSVLNTHFLVDQLNEQQVKVTLNHDEIPQFIELLHTSNLPYTDFLLLNKGFESVYQEFYDIKEGD
ncbi:MAG: ABC transporter ATP-binding protein [Turicibacter sp.]